MKIYPHLAAESLSNIYVVSENSDAVIVDVGKLDNHLITYIEENKLSIRAYLITNSSVGHTIGLGTIEKIYRAPIYAYEDMVAGLETIVVKDGDKIQIGPLNIEALHIPGKYSDNLCYIINNTAFTGDTIYAGTIAKTDSHIQQALLIKNIREKLFTLEDNTLLCPGRGPLSKVGLEKKFNVDIVTNNS